MNLTYEVVTEAEFPYGVVCSLCGRELQPGQPYTSKPDAMLDNDPIEVLACVYC